MFDLKQKNTQLSEPLRKAIRDVEALQEELRCYEVDKKRLAEVKEKIKEQEKTYSRLQSICCSVARLRAESRSHGRLKIVRHFLRFNAQL